MEALGGLLIIVFVVFLIMGSKSDTKEKMESSDEDSYYEPVPVRQVKQKPVKVKHVHKHIAPKEKKASRFSSSLHCPKCRSFNVQVVGNTRKGFSVGKAVGGAALNGRIGTLAGFAGKQNKRPKFHCLSCGHVFKHRI